MSRPPICGISRSVMLPLRPADFREVDVGIPIGDLAPKQRGLLICRVNGDFLSRESWGSCTRLDDVIEWHDYPQDRDVLRGVLSIVSIFLPMFWGLQGAALLAAQVAAQLAINALLPPTVAQQRRPEQTGDSFSTSLQGNEARLDQPIWKVCGRREITPPFACQPYQEYLPRPGATDQDLDREQFYYVVLAVGVGNHDVFAKLGNTPLSRFADVLVAQYLAPGELPSSVLANVTTAQEVSSQVLETGQYVGGFAACAARRTCSAIGIDVVATRGLGKEDPLTVSWRVEYRPINDFGQVLGAWTILGTESRTAFTATPQRWSNRYELGSASRVEVRVVRTDLRDTSPSALHEIAWTGLRAYLAEPAPLNQHTAHYELVMRASSQLSNVAARDVRLIVEAKVRTLDGSLDWQAEASSRNPIWWILDLATSSTWGVNKPDSRIDLQSFYDLAQIAETRQDRFDWVFDSSVNAWDAMQLIARSCRSRVSRRNGVLTIARDELADVPVTAFTPRNCLPGMKVSENLRRRNSPDGVIVEYQDHRTWEWTEVPCPCPGVDDAYMVRPVRKRLEGVTGATHAEREGLYEAFNLLYRPRTAQCVTEMQGLLPAYMSPVDFLADIRGYGSSGDVAFWDADTLVMGLTEPPDWSAAPLFLTLIRDDGSCTDEVEVTPGPTANDVVLPAEPDFELVLDIGTRERPKYLIGAKDMAKVFAIEDGGRADDGAQLYRISLLIDDERVHTADVHLLPGPGEIQDPVGNPDDSGEVGSGDLIVNLADRTITATYLSGVGSNSLQAQFTLGNNGILSWFVQHGSGTESGDVTGQWILSGEIETAQAALFDVRFTDLTTVSPPNPDLTSPTLGDWHSLGTSRTVTYVGAGTLEGNIIKIRVEIRAADTLIVQQTRTITLNLHAPEVGG